MQIVIVVRCSEVNRWCFACRRCCQLLIDPVSACDQARTLVRAVIIAAAFVRAIVRAIVRASVHAIVRTHEQKVVLGLSFCFAISFRSLRFVATHRKHK